MIKAAKHFMSSVIMDFKFPTILQFAILYFIKYRKSLSLYKKLRKQCGSAAICICPYKGTGDVYLAATYFKDSADDKEDSLFCVIGMSNEQIAKLFQLNARILKFSERQITLLTQFAFFVGPAETNIRILHHAPLNWHCGINDCFRNINGLIFTDLIGYGAFKVENPKKLARPVFLEKDEDTERLFIKEGLKRGKTVLLAPFSYTFTSYPEWFWKKLVIELKALGFSVCTNLGSRKEKAIPGSKGIFLRYEQLGLFLRNAGWFIGIRSGLCDVISSAVCKKIILYQPYLFWGEGENMDYFSLNKMGLCSDAIEIQNKGIEFISLIFDIKNIVRKHVVLECEGGG